MSLRIVFVLALADLAGGVRVIATYARLLQQRGHHVTIVSAPPRAPSVRERVRALLRGRGWMAGPRAGPSHIDDVPVEHRILERFRPVTDRDVPDADVVVATWWETAEWVAALSPGKGARAHFVQGHDLERPGPLQERFAATWRMPFQRIVCSRWLLELARSRYGDATACYVPNGVDAERFWAPARGKQARPTIGMVYAADHIKGCDVGLAAYAIAARRVPGLALIAFGSSAVNGALPLPPRAEFILRPDQRQIPGIYARCDAWLWPSRCEGFGLPILEAMACRTPVIAAPAGAAPDILAQGGGTLLPGADPAAMADAIGALCALPDAEWRAVSESARANAVRWSWESSVRQFEAALELAIGRSSGRREPDERRSEASGNTS